MSAISAIFIIIWIIRAITNNSGGGSGKPAGTANRQTNIPGWIGIFLVKIFVFSMAALVLGDGKWPAQIAYFLIGVVLFFPTFVVNSVIVPLGMYRTAYWTFRWLFPSGFGGQYRLAATYVAALAVARKRKREKACEWLEDQMTYAASPHLSYDMLIGLLAALRGKDDTAVSVFHLIDTTRGERHMRRTARDWLVAHAAAQGDWQEVIWRGKRGGDSFRWSYTVARMAERLDRRDTAASNGVLIALWLIAPRRRRLLPLLRHALAVPVGAPRQATSAVRPVIWPQALSQLAGMLQEAQRSGMPPTQASFVHTISGVSTTLAAPRLRMQMELRLRTLDPGRQDIKAGADSAFEAARAQLVRTARGLIERTPELAEGQGDLQVISEAVAEMRERAFQDIETRAEDFRRRANDNVMLPREEEWAAWSNLRVRAERLLKLAPQVEDALFSAMFSPICNFAVFQHNKLQRHPFAHSIFCWLHLRSSGNPEAMELLKKNAMTYDGMRRN